MVYTYIESTLTAVEGREVMRLSEGDHWNSKRFLKYKYDYASQCTFNLLTRYSKVLNTNITDTWH